MNENRNRLTGLSRLASLLLATTIVAAAACSSGDSSREPFVDVDAAPADAAAEARGDAAVIEGGSDDCSGVKCRADQICLRGCTAMGDTSCFLSIEPTRVCVDLPNGCSRADACSCVSCEAHSKISGRGIVDCYDDGPDAIKCLCGCRL